MPKTPSVSQRKQNLEVGPLEELCQISEPRIGSLKSNHGNGHESIAVWNAKVRKHSSSDTTQNLHSPIEAISFYGVTFLWRVRVAAVMFWKTFTFYRVILTIFTTFLLHLNKGPCISIPSWEIVSICGRCCFNLCS